MDKCAFKGKLDNSLGYGINQKLVVETTRSPLMEDAGCGFQKMVEETMGVWLGGQIYCSSVNNASVFTEFLKKYYPQHR